MNDVICNCEEHEECVDIKNTIMATIDVEANVFHNDKLDRESLSKRISKLPSVYQFVLIRGLKFSIYEETLRHGNNKYYRYDRILGDILDYIMGDDYVVDLLEPISPTLWIDETHYEVTIDGVTHRFKKYIKR